MKTRHKIFVGSIGATFAMVIALLASNGISNNFLNNPNADATSYTLTLDSSNAYTSGTSKQISTDSGAWNVGFSYTSCSASSGNHAQIDSVGSIKNTDHILSIKSFKAVFSGSLQIRTSYDGGVWSDYFDVTSNQDFNLSESKPYYIEMKPSSGTVDLTSAKFTYYCIEHEIPVGGYKRVESVSELVVGKKVIIAAQTSWSSSSCYVLNKTVYNDYYLTANFANISNNYLVSTNDATIWTIGKVDGKLTFINGSDYLSSVYTNSHYNLVTRTSIDDDQSGVKSSKWTVTPESDSYEGFRIMSDLNRYVEYYGNKFLLYTDTSKSYLTNFYIETSAKPKEAISFAISDSGKYRVGKTYSNSTLTVTVNYTDGSQEDVDNYEWTMKDPSGNPMTKPVTFEVTGNHTLTVTYGSLGSKTITIAVSEATSDWELVTDASSLQAGDVFVIGEIDNGTTAGAISSQYLQAVDTTFDTENKSIKDIPTDSLQLTLGGSSGEWTLANSDGKLLGATAEKKLAWNNGTTTWKISIDSDGNATIQNGTSSYGKFLYNVGSPRFTVYSTAASATMVLPQIYRGAAAKPIYATDISLNPTSTTLNVGATQSIAVTYTPDNTTKKDIVWSTANSSIATVDSTGLITAVSKGNTTITATYTKEDSTTIEKTCLVTVNNVAVTGVTLNQSSLGLTVGSSATLTATVAPSNATIKTVSWSSNNESIATVSSSGLVSAVSTGNAIITVTTTDGNKTATCSVTVSPAPIHVTSVSLDQTSKTINKNESFTLTATVLPNDATDKTVSWTSSNDSIATVSSSGLVTAIAGGSATITVTTTDGNKTATCSVTVNVPTTGVLLSQTTATVSVSSTVTLTATVAPSDASNKNVSWTTSASSVATVSNGVVTGVATGNATITVTTQNGGYTATCLVSVKESSGTLTIQASNLPTSYSTTGTATVSDTSGTSHKLNAYNLANFGNGMQFKASSGYLSNQSALTIQSIELVTQSGKTFNGTLYWGTSANPSTNEVSVNNGSTYLNTGSYTYFKLLKSGSGAGYLSKVIITLGTVEPVDPTGISILSSSTIEQGSTMTLDVTYSPSNCNRNKGINWTTSNSSVATVASGGEGKGTITGVAVGTATITATSTYNASFISSCIVTVTEEAIDKWTILMYVCGADLESQNSLATGDFTEICSVSNQPDDVNIVIQTGGATSWNSKYGISSSSNQRYHVENKTLVCDNSKVYSSYTSMGLSSTFKDFLTWGIQTYPAEKTGVILWNHGGGMRGVCYDEKKDDDSLTNSEMKSAVSSAMSTVGRTDKLEFIGFDACLMQVQDIAEFMSPYFNYMIGSEESESGYGWDYDNWVDDLYAKKDTSVILKAICDSFIAENGGTSSSSNDQTLSYLNLSYASAYKTAWESFASGLSSKLGSTSATTFISWVVSNVKHFGDSDYNYFHLFDAKDFVNKVAASSSYNPGSSYTSAVLTAFSNFVAYSICGKGAGNAYGLCCVYVCTQDTQYVTIDSYYTTSHTNFTTWRTFCRNYGDLD